MLFPGFDAFAQRLRAKIMNDFDELGQDALSPWVFDGLHDQ